MIAARCVLILLATAALWSQTRPAAPHANTAAAHARRPGVTAPTLSDSQIEKAIRARFAASKIGANHFEVHVQGGVATLEGRTDVLQHKGTATRLAKSAGASGVNNQIQVSEAAREQASANLAKGRRRAQIKRSEVNARSEREHR